MRGIILKEKLRVDRKISERLFNSSEKIENFFKTTIGFTS